ncbi:MAG: DUF3152 domain-containing protein, partial [Gaiellales bacterium]
GQLRSCGVSRAFACSYAAGATIAWRIVARPSEAAQANQLVTLRLHRRARTGAWVQQLTLRERTNDAGVARISTRSRKLQPGIWTAQASVGADDSARQYLRISAPPATLITYSTGSIGISPTSATMREFRAIVAATLNDPRGWSLNGRLRFREVRNGGSKITLASPGAVASFGGCSAYWSCRAGSYVLINEDRWNHGTAVYPGASRTHEYRNLVINHEFGHALGLGHAGCSGRGRPAPAMMQQSKGLGGCRTNVWPLTNERSAVARRRGITTPAAPPTLEPGIAADGVELGMRLADVRPLHGDPQRTKRPTKLRRIDSYERAALRVTYDRGVVTEIQTRSPRSCTLEGVCVGGSVAAVRRLDGARCTINAAGRGACVLAPKGQVGGSTPTIFMIRRHRVSAVLLRWVPPPRR